MLYVAVDREGAVGAFCSPAQAAGALAGYAGAVPLALLEFGGEAGEGEPVFVLHHPASGHVVYAGCGEEKTRRARAALAAVGLADPDDDPLFFALRVGEVPPGAARRLGRARAAADPLAREAFAAAGASPGELLAADVLPVAASLADAIMEVPSRQ